jgi:zinc protease
MNRMTVRSTTHGLLFAALAFLGAYFFMSHSSHAMQIKRVISPGGIEAWLVEQHNLPVISVRIGFRGGTANDPQDKQGLAYLFSGMIDEGAGKYDSQAFQHRLEELTMELSFDASRDSFTGRMKTLTRNRDEAFEMLRLALIEPRFDAAPLARIRRQIIAELKQEEQDPDSLAYRTWFSTAFGDHPYGRNKKGTPEGLKAIMAEDLRVLGRKLLTRDSLRIVVVGDIDEKTLAALLDRTFGLLQAKTGLTPVPEITPDTSVGIRLVPMDIPQSVIVFGLPGIKIHDPDFIPAFLMNYILGGGGFSSRLTEEVREKRGLTYSVYSFLLDLAHSGVFMGSASTKNASAGKALELIKMEIARMAEEGVTPAELKSAQTYLTGSYPLRFDSGSKIAGQLIGIQMDELGIDYINTRNDRVNAVTMDDIKRVARRLLKADSLLTVIVGAPVNVGAGK